MATNRYLHCRYDSTSKKDTKKINLAAPCGMSRMAIEFCQLYVGGVFLVDDSTRSIMI
jgi:hypothetical protein